jgi:hypothetical protein
MNGACAGPTCVGAVCAGATCSGGECQPVTVVRLRLGKEEVDLEVPPESGVVGHAFHR